MDALNALDMPLGMSDVRFEVRRELDGGSWWGERARGAVNGARDTTTRATRERGRVFEAK